LNWITQLLLALDKLHSEGFVHLDIKPNNIFLKADDINGIVKLGDFGNSKNMDTLVLSTKDNGTVAYNSPERFDSIISEKADVWSIGCVLYFLLTSGGHPFAD
jgi:eukaryotic-like serine/threonine-protein kinase